MHCSHAHVHAHTNKTGQKLSNVDNTTSPRSEVGVGAGGSKAKQEVDVDLPASPQGNKLHRPTVSCFTLAANGPHAFKEV